MDTLSFLQRVLPTEGIYCTIVVERQGEKDYLRQAFYNSVGELEQALISLDKRKRNVYYATSAFVTKESRKQSNVRTTKALYMDVDCGEGKDYPSQKEGLQALLKFIKDTGLPKPMVVSSGNGLHVYWVLTRELEPTEWQPLADAMKRCVYENNFKQDMSVPADSARVLRAVGTHNPKGGNQVKLLVDKPPVTPEQMAECFKDYIVAPPVGLKKAVQGSSLLANLAVEQEYPPSVASVVKTKCQQIAWAVDNQDQVQEPMWYNLIGVAAFCVDPEETAKEWSKNHPSYDEAETLRKLRNWRQAVDGPTTCAKFDSERPGGCKGCPFSGKIGSPTRLGAQFEEVDTSADAPEDVITEINIPKPFKRAQSGIKITLDDTDIDVCDFDIYPVSYGRDESLGYEVCRFKWNRPHVGWQDLILRQAYLADGTYQYFVSIVADQGIVLITKKQTEYFQYMLRSYMNELRKFRTMTNLYASMGWKEDHKLFVLGDTLYRRKPDSTIEKESIKLASASSRIGSDMFGVSGDLDTWKGMTGLLQRADLDAHMFSIGISLASPLLEFTGLKGMTVSLFGKTGGGKSLAQLMAQSVWGNPDKLHFQAKYTQNTLFSRFGLYANLPITIDEVTMMSDKDVGDFLYWVSQGRDKARLNRNAEEREAKTWATFCIVSTNRPLSSKMVASGLDTDAQMARLLELTVTPSKLFTDSSNIGKKLFDLMSTNYGGAGDIFIQKLMEIGPEGLRAMIAEATNNFHSKYGVKFTGEERYWEQVIILADLAINLAQGWGLLAFKSEPCVKWALSQISTLRRTVSENQIDAFDLISEYLNEFAGDTVRVMHTGKIPMVDYERVPRNGIRARVDVHRKVSSDPFDSGTLMLDRAHFRKWLSTRGGDYKGITDILKQELADATPSGMRASLGRDTPIKIPQTYVIGINLRHPRMVGLLDEAEIAYEDLTLGQLQIVP
jgi:hypothetical protein